MKPGDVYKLPYTPEESNRLDLQHRLLTLALNGLYPSHIAQMVDKLLDSEGARVLDIGCGSGVWSVEMSRKFPTAKVTGIDLVLPAITSPPPNLELMFHDLSTGLPADFGRRFDVIHCRLVMHHAKDPLGLVKEIARCLKPGGVLLMADADFILGGFDENKQPLKTFTYHPSLSIEENIRAAYESSGSWYTSWMCSLGPIIQSPKYKRPDGLVEDSKAFDEWFFKTLWLPVKWVSEEFKNIPEVGHLNYLNVKNIYDHTARLFAEPGIPGSFVEAWKTKCFEEVESCRRYFVFHYVAAVKARSEELTGNVK